MSKNNSNKNRNDNKSSNAKATDPIIAKSDQTIDKPTRGLPRV